MITDHASRPRLHTPQTRLQLPQTLKRVVWFFFAAVVIFGIGFWVFYSFILQTKWNEGTTKNIVIIPKTIDVSTDVILFTSISYKEDLMTFNSLPANDAVQVPGGYGEYPLKSVFPLLGLDKKSDQTVIATYSNLLGMPINEVWVTDDERIFRPESTISELAHVIVTGKLNNPLGLKERVKLYRFMNDKLPKRVDYPSLEAWQMKQASRYVGALKDCRIAIVNTTPVAGLGRKVSQVLERSGMTVVRLTDASPTVDKSSLTIQTDIQACKELADHLKQLFPDHIEVKEDAQTLSRSRSEAEVILGKDIGEFLKQ